MHKVRVRYGSDGLFQLIDRLKLHLQEYLTNHEDKAFVLFL